MCDSLEFLRGGDCRARHRRVPPPPPGPGRPRAPCHPRDPLRCIPQAVYLDICRGIFKKHKIMFAFLMAVQIMRQSNAIKPEEWQFFLRAAAFEGSACGAARGRAGPRAGGTGRGGRAPQTAVRGLGWRAANAMGDQTGPGVVDVPPRFCPLSWAVP